MTSTPDTHYLTGNWPITNITPFTYRAGATNLQILLAFQRWAERFGPEVQDILDSMFSKWLEEFERLENKVDAKLLEWEELFDTFMADIVNQLEGLNDQSMANLIGNKLSKTRLALELFFVQKNELYFNVQDYGTIPDGDAAEPTDNTAAVTAAMNAARGTFGQGGTVLFTPGSYYWSGVVEHYSNVEVWGRGATLRKRLGGDKGTFFATFSHGNLGYGSGASNISYRNLTLRGDFARGIGATLFSAHHSNDVEITNCTFIECVTNGHIADLQGCSNVYVHRSKFIGRSGSDARKFTECIQLDNSARLGASEPDDPGSYDGLPTINVTVDSCEFLPLTIGGVEYSAPNPIGSHWGVEGHWQSGIKFTNNIVDTPIGDTTSTARGIIHLFAVNNVEVAHNKFINRKHVQVSAVWTYGMYTAVPMENVNKVPDGSYMGVVIPPQCSNNVSVHDNEFIGFNNPGTAEHIVYLRGHADKNVLGGKVYNNKYVDCGQPDNSNKGPHLVNLINADDVKVYNNEADGFRRLVYAQEGKNISVYGNSLKNASTSAAAIHFDRVINPKAVDNDFNGYTAGVFSTLCSGIKYVGNTFKGDRGAGRALDIDSGTRFNVYGNDVEATVDTTKGFVARGSTSKGFVDKNILTGMVLPIEVTPTSSATLGVNITE